MTVPFNNQSSLRIVNYLLSKKNVKKLETNINLTKLCLQDLIQCPACLRESCDLELA